MIFNLPIADIQHKDIIFEDDFSNNVAGWETIEDEDEKAYVQKVIILWKTVLHIGGCFIIKNYKSNFPGILSSILKLNYCNSTTMVSSV